MDRKYALWLKKIVDTGRAIASSCPPAHKKTLEEYLHRDILRSVSIKKRSYIEVIDLELVQALIDKYVIEAVEGAPARSNAILLNKDSKIGGSLNYLMLNFRSASKDAEIEINGKVISVGTETKNSGVYSVFTNSNLNTKLKFNAPLYLIENLEAWAEAERYLPKEAIYLLYQGWLSKKLMDQLKNWIYPEIILSPDYDMVGLHNWLKIKSTMPEVGIHFPDNFSDLLEKYPAKHLWSKQFNLLTMVDSLCAASNDHIACQWLNAMKSNGACLEQEALLIHKNQDY